MHSSATRATIEMSQKMAAAGADAVMIVTPSYYKSGMKVVLLVQLIFMYIYIFLDIYLSQHLYLSQFYMESHVQCVLSQ